MRKILQSGLGGRRQNRSGRWRPGIRRRAGRHGHSTDLLATLWCYLDNGRSLEATARELFVHPNTVRYRLKRVSEVIGWDATGAREALILQAALIVGSIADPDGSKRR
jgi:sugar diacid utilization regulator